MCDLLDLILSTRVRGCEPGMAVPEYASICVTRWRRWQCWYGSRIHRLTAPQTFSRKAMLFFPPVVDRELVTSAALVLFIEPPMFHGVAEPLGGAEHLVHESLSVPLSLMSVFDENELIAARHPLRIMFALDVCANVTIIIRDNHHFISVITSLTPSSLFLSQS